ncbi:hypothetical protein B0H15DRAFT_943706 [Mycena belliarum]|uniref:DUF6593 domain-containing protein n=1 Tax=Mycena belliarum TaxID=1033014 RepID=A0AAD6XT62_9AGAR|nr:hypothetical protein B0H15DRAFT_943706 [Mycena belliae]
MRAQTKMHHRQYCSEAPRAAPCGKSLSWIISILDIKRPRRGERRIMHAREPCYSSINMGRTTPTPRRLGRGARRSTTPTPVSYDEDVLSLDFVCRRNGRSVLNCTVVARGTFTPYFHIATHSDARTFFRTNKGDTVAAIQWRGAGGATFVEVDKAVLRQRVSEWMRVSGDASYRMMEIRGQGYVWVPQDNSICMYLWNPGSSTVPELLARIEKANDTVTLEITSDAMVRGLLEIAVVAATLFQSGCCID